MLYRPKSENGDVLPVYRKDSLLDSRHAVAKLIEDRIRHFKGVWWEYPEQGYEGFEILGKTGGEEQLEAIANATVDYLKLTQGVKKIENVAARLEGRSILITCDIYTQNDQPVSLQIRSGEDGIFQTLY